MCSTSSLSGALGRHAHLSTNGPCPNDWVLNHAGACEGEAFDVSIDEVIDDVGIRAGKDGTVVTIADTSVVLSGVFDFTVADSSFLSDSDWPA